MYLNNENIINYIEFPCIKNELDNAGWNIYIKYIGTYIVPILCKI